MNALVRPTDVITSQDYFGWADHVPLGPNGGKAAFKYSIVIGLAHKPAWDFFAEWWRKNARNPDIENTFLFRHIEQALTTENKFARYVEKEMCFRYRDFARFYATTRQRNPMQ